MDPFEDQDDIAPRPESTAVRELVGRGSLYTIGGIVQLSAGLLVLPALTRLLSVPQFGRVAAAVVVAQLLSRIVGLGLPGAITRTYFDGATGPEQSRRLLPLSLAVSVALAAVADLTGPLWSQMFHELEYGWLLRLAVWSAVPQSVVLAAHAYLRADNRPFRFVVSVGLASLGAQAMGLLFVSQFDATAESYFWGFFSGMAMAGLYSLLASSPLAPRLDRPALRGAFAFGLPLVPHMLALYFLSAGDRVIVERLEGLRAVGQYQAAYVVGALGLYGVQALNNAWSPIVLGERDDRRWHTLATTTAAVYRLTGTAVAGLAIGAPLALRVAAPSSYEPSDLVWVTALVAPAALLYATYLSWSHVLFHFRRTGAFGWTTPVAAVFNAVCTLVLVPPLGLEGAAVSTLLTYSLQVLLIRRAARPLVEVEWERGSLAREWALVAVALAVAAVLPTDGTALAVRGAAMAVLVALFFHRLLRLRALTT